MKNLGDKIASVATPVARTLKLPCIDPTTNELRPESPCARAKANLNSGMNLADSFYDAYFKPYKPNKE